MRRFKKPHLLIASHIDKTGLFFFMMCSLIVFLYITGTRQEFQDSSQLFLLRIGTVFGILLSIFSLFGLIIGIADALATKERRLVSRFVVCALSFGGGIALAAVFSLILAVSMGR